MIKEITVKNYKIYKGLHRIALSTSPDFPVTVVSADNGSGKTTFIGAVYWCLYGHTPENTGDLLNYEVIQEMAVGETETVEVELCYTEDHDSFIIFRSATYRKLENGVIHCPELDCYISNADLFPLEAVAPAMLISETLNFRKRPLFHNMVNKIGYRYLSKYRIRNHEKLEALNQAVMLKIADSASAIFSKLYFRYGDFKIIWNGGFSILRTDLKLTLNDLSETDEIVFFTSILHGIREVLFEKSHSATIFPIFIDGIFGWADPSQFYLDRLIQALPGRQIVVFARENNLAEQSLHEYCGALYSMHSTKNCTNVSIQQLEIPRNTATARL